jgi:hypothetical protein
MFTLLLAFAVQGDVVKIPFKDIWAYNIPGTTEVSEKEEKPKNATPAEWMRFNRESLVNQIYIGLGDRKRGQLAEKGFCVAETGLNALKAAHAVLVKHEKPQEEFANGTDITLVFFSHSVGSFVHLVDVERNGREIQIRYRFKPRMELYLTTHFALIPLGKLKPGEYEVKLVQMPMVNPGHPQDGQLAPDELIDQIICKPFLVLVTDK